MTLDNLVKWLAVFSFTLFGLAAIDVVCQLVYAQTYPDPPVAPNASFTVFDTTPPGVHIPPSGWAWPTCTEDGVTVEHVGKRDPGGLWRRSTWVFTDPGLNQTIVTRTEFTLTTHVRHEVPQ